MEHPNSLLVDPSTYDTTMDGLCTNMPLHVHRNASLADRGALRAQRDWQRFFGPLPLGYSGVMGPEHNFVSTCMPEILPGRLELVAYIMEVMCMMDDMVDAAESPTAAAAPCFADLMTAHDVIKKGGDISSCSPAVGIMARFGKAMYDVDPGLAEDTFRRLSKTITTLLSRPSDGQNIRDFDEYLKYRCINFGSQYVTALSPTSWFLFIPRSNRIDRPLFGLMIFGIGLSIPEDQQQTCLDLSQPFWLQLSLANDYHSWEREYKAAINSCQTSVTNAIWILMNKHSMTCDEAKAVCRERARQYASEYEQVVEAAKAREDLCLDAKLLLEQFKFGISGNIVWALQCPRYQADRKLNATQLEMAEAIWADESNGWDYAEPKTVKDATEHSGVKGNGALLNDAVTNNSLIEVDLTNSALSNNTIPSTDDVLTNTDGLCINGTLTNGSSPQTMAAVRDVPALGTEVSTPDGGFSARLDQIADHLDRSSKHHRATSTHFLVRVSVTRPSTR